MSSPDALAKAIGQEDAEAVLRLLNECPLSTLMNAAKDADHEWTEWARAAAVLQRWTETRGISADVHRKIGYLTCAAEGIKSAPAAMRPSLAEAVADFLAHHGFSPEN
jgi:hypothetical protein